MRLAQALSVSALALAMTVAGAAAAEPARDQARNHVRAGVAYAERGKWDDALHEFEEAYGLDPTPATLFDVAQARLKVGRYRAARQAFEELLASPGALSAAQLGTAKKGVDLAASKIARVEVSGAASGDRVAIDGDAVDASGAVEVDPGAHVVTLLRDGQEVSRREISPLPGERLTIAFDAPRAAPPVVPGPPADAPPRERPGPPVLGLAIGGAGVIVAGVGAVLAVSALSDRSDLASTCGATKSCAQGDVDDVRTRAAIADVTVGVGLVATAVGAYLAFLAPRAPVTPVASPAPGGGYAGLRGAFW